MLHRRPKLLAVLHCSCPRLLAVDKVRLYDYWTKLDDMQSNQSCSALLLTKRHDSFMSGLAAIERHSDNTMSLLALTMVTSIREELFRRPHIDKKNCYLMIQRNTSAYSLPHIPLQLNPTQIHQWIPYFSNNAVSPTCSNILICKIQLQCIPKSN